VDSTPQSRYDESDSPAKCRVRVNRVFPIVRAGTSTIVSSSPSPPYVATRASQTRSGCAGTLVSLARSSVGVRYTLP
jgi:hypothetical protein